MEGNIFLSSHEGAPELAYWKYISAAWLGQGFTPYLVVVCHDVDNPRGDAADLTELWGRVFRVKKIEIVDIGIQGKIAKFFAATQCEVLFPQQVIRYDEVDVCIMSDLRTVPLNTNWLKDMLSQKDSEDSEDSEDSLSIPFPEVRCQYMFGKSTLFGKMFNHRKHDYEEWIVSLMRIDGEDLSGNVMVGKNIFSSDSFLYNMVDRLDGFVPVKLVPRPDIKFTSEKSYNLTNQLNTEYLDNIPQTALHIHEFYDMTVSGSTDHEKALGLLSNLSESGARSPPSPSQEMSKSVVITEDVNFDFSELADLMIRSEEDVELIQEGSLVHIDNRNLKFLAEKKLPVFCLISGGSTPIPNHEFNRGDCSDLIDKVSWWASQNCYIDHPRVLHYPLGFSNIHNYPDLEILKDPCPHAYIHVRSPFSPRMETTDIWFCLKNDIVPVVLLPDCMADMMFGLPIYNVPKWDSVADPHQLLILYSQLVSDKGKRYLDKDHWERVVLGTR